MVTGTRPEPASLFSGEYREGMIRMHAGQRTGGQAVLVLGLGLIVLAGCSTGEQPMAAPQFPPPTRALVAWSDMVCTNTKSVDSLRAQIDSVNKDANDPSETAFVGMEAEFYISRVTSESTLPRSR
ncbi:MAG TPA: hypothetical protein VIY28_15760 [Pseudonocardiaceae bacterium]